MAKSSSLKAELLALVLKAARWQPLRPLVSFLYTHLPRFLPVDRLGENAGWIAFHHPQPVYPLHILILPKQEIHSLPNAPVGDTRLYAALFLLVNQLIEKFDLEARGYRLITNGGPHQSIPIWHWHLVCEVPDEGSAQPGGIHA